MNDTDIKVKIIIISLVIIIVVTIGIYAYKSYKEDDSYNINLDIYSETENKEENNQEIEMITVHVTGEVKYAGVVVLKEGDRIVDAIEAAGGETENADLNKLNLAYILSDGDKIYVPNKNDALEIDDITIVNEDLNSSKKLLININTASAQELTELPGIGEATAKKIIEYRTQNGKFKTIEEIKNVPGIGDSKFENLKDKIRV